MATNNLKEFFGSISEGIDLGEGFDVNSIPDVELPESFNTSFHNKYLTVLSAKNNKDVMGHFRGQYLNDADNRLKSSFLANGGTAEMFAELKDQEPDSMKLIDLIFGKGIELNKGAANGDNAEFEAYKIQTAKEMKELLTFKENSIDSVNSAINTNNLEWSKKMKNTMITSKLNSKNFDGGMSQKDAVYLTMRGLEDSDFELRLDENLQEKVYQKSNPEFEATVEGKNVTWDFVLDELAKPYLKKNNQQQQQTTTVVNVPPASGSGISNDEGYYIVGHPNYNKVPPAE
jgi:hypothetical protein